MTLGVRLLTRKFVVWWGRYVHNVFVATCIYLCSCFRSIVQHEDLSLPMGYSGPEHIRNYPTSSEKSTDGLAVVNKMHLL